MRGARYFILIVVACLCVLAGTARAGEVRVFKPMEEGVSRMELRNQAMAEGYAQAVLEEARRMLPGELGEVRTELLREHLLDHAEPYVQGYRILSSEAMDAGLILVLDVRVNKQSLREGLKNMGLFATVHAPQTAGVTWPADLDEASVTRLQGLMTLSGIQAEQGVLPAFSLESGPEGTFKGRLELDNREWVTINKDMTVVWFELWSRFFNRAEAVQARANVFRLSVSGWFSPDAALEFDRVLNDWDSAVQEVQLVELDMQPSGVGGLWEVRLLNGERFGMLLQGYLPQRGLSYQLSEAAK